MDQKAANKYKFRKKLDLIIQCLSDKYGSVEKLQEKITPDLFETGNKKYVVFVSICNKKKRCSIVRASGDSLVSALKSATEKAEKVIDRGKLDPVWVKLDIMNKSERGSLSDVIKNLPKDFNEFFRKGISFDEDYASVLLEAEINGNRLIDYKGKTIKAEKIAEYTGKHCTKAVESLPETIILFNCLGFLSDNKNNVYPLYNEGVNCGRRIIEELNKEDTKEIVISAADYLLGMLDAGGEKGKFQYGFYPIFHKVLENYNILRHTSTIWGLLRAYRVTGEKKYLENIKPALTYMRSYLYEDHSKGAMYLVEKSSGEIKLGGNGLALITLAEYMDITGSSDYIDICRRLGDGILEQMDHDTGEFTHVINYPDLTVKDKYRIVYYDGEATFGLCKVYSMTNDTKYLQAAIKSVDRFIAKNYIQYRDHWVGYAMNEITLYEPREEYFEFALRNVQENMDAMYKRRTTYHTYMELLSITYKLYLRMIDNDIKIKYLDKFDVLHFIETIKHRAKHMLNGYAYPEYAMYLKYPDKVLGSFFVRHDGYRVRIDDVQHFLCGYISYYEIYDRLCI